jgi:hypothetical protein
VVINGVTIQCQTPTDAVRLANEVAVSSSATPPTTMQPPTPMVPPSMTSVPMFQPVIPGLEESKWAEPAKKVITMLVQAGDDGIDTDRIAEAAGLKGPQGSSSTRRSGRPPT